MSVPTSTTTSPLGRVLTTVKGARHPMRATFGTTMSLPAIRGLWSRLFMKTSLIPSLKDILLSLGMLGARTIFSAVTGSLCTMILTLSSTPTPVLVRVCPSILMRPLSSGDPLNTLRAADLFPTTSMGSPSSSPISAIVAGSILALPSPASDLLFIGATLSSMRSAMRGPMRYPFI